MSWWRERPSKIFKCIDETRVFWEWKCQIEKLCLKALRVAVMHQMSFAMSMCSVTTLGRNNCPYSTVHCIVFNHWEKTISSCVILKLRLLYGFKTKHKFCRWMRKQTFPKCVCAYVCAFVVWYFNVLCVCESGIYRHSNLMCFPSGSTGMSVIYKGISICKTQIPINNILFLFLFCF